MRNILRASALLLLLTAACESPEVFQPEREVQLSQAPAPGASTDAVLKAVRQATSRFHSPTQAIRAGYVPTEHCAAIPGVGGMGYHWMNQELLDEVFDPLQPEILLYAARPNGRVELVGVEYIVVDVGQGRPSFGDHPFDIGGTPMPFDHYSLHVWLYEANPNGIFAPWNPNVSCP